MTEILQDLSLRQAVIDAIEVNMFPFWMGYGQTEGYQAIENERLMYFSTGIPLPLLNGVFHAQLTSIQIEPTIRETISYFRERGLPAFWWVGPTTRPSDLGEHLARESVRKVGNLPGMAMPLSALPDSVPVPENFHIELVRDTDTQRKWIEILLIANNVPPESIPAAIEMDLRRKPELPRYLAYLGDEPVATSALQTGAGVAGLYGVGTLPEARGKGIGAAVTLHAMLEARSAGYHVGVLQSSDMGHPVYQRLGFKDYCQFELYLI